MALSLLLWGCAADKPMEEALAIRSRMISSGCSFDCQITADYIDHVEQFSLSCATSENGAVEFEVVAPEPISGIRGSVEGTEGSLNFDDLILAFPVMADERLSPLAAPWLLISSLRSGCISACVREEELLHLSIDDTYDDDPLTLEIWLDAAGSVTACEIGWRGRRLLSMEVSDFVYV